MTAGSVAYASLLLADALGRPLSELSADVRIEAAVTPSATAEVGVQLSPDDEDQWVVRLRVTGAGRYVTPLKNL